jgi:hypothetical protein
MRNKRQLGTAFMTEEQTTWSEMNKMVLRLKPPQKLHIPKQSLRRCVCIALTLYIWQKQISHFIIQREHKKTM